MTNRGLFFILICHLLAPLACQIREEGQQTNLAETPVLPPSTLQAKVETRSEGPDDYAIRLMWLPTIPVRITRSYIETKPDGRVFENSESFEVTDPTGEYFDAKVQAGLAYRYEVQPLDVASPRFSPESLEVKVPRDSVITMENLITNYGRETSTFAWTTARGFIPEKEKVWLSGGDYRLEFDQIRIGKDAEMILQSHVDPAVSRQFMDLRPEFLTNLTRNTSKGIWVSLFAKQAVGNLKIKFERGVESEQMGLMIDVADAELFKVTLVQSGTLKEDDLIVVRTGDQYQFLEKGVLSPLEPHLGIYEPIVPKEGEPDYILISYGGGKVHLHWDTFFGEQVLVEKRYRRIKTTSDLPEANYQKMTQERIAASPPRGFSRFPGSRPHPSPVSRVN